MTLDRCDLSILEALERDGRASLTDIGKGLGLSRFAVKDKIEKLFRDQLILGSTVIIDPSMVGFKRTVFFEFKTNPNEPWLAEFLEKMKECDVLDGITGEYSLLGRFRIADEEHFGQILRRIDEVVTKSFFKKYRVVNVISTFKESGVPFERKAVPVSLDDVDLMILRILLNQTRYIKTPQPLSTMQISRLLSDLGVKISQPSVFKRLKRLKDQGIILRHTILINQEKMGFKTKLVARIKVNPASYDDVARNFLVPMDEITDLYRTGEDYGLLAILRVRGVSEYNAFLLGLYASKDTIDTHTTLVLEERKNHPSYL